MMATPRNEIEKGIEKYLFTYQHEAGRGSLHPHHPSPKSGVTIGAGYDLSKFPATPEGKLTAYNELVSRGIEQGIAQKLSEAVGLTGSKAHKWAHDHEKSITITEEDQKNLYNATIPEYEQKTQRILLNLAADEKNNIDVDKIKWDGLDDNKQSMYFDLAYNGVLNEYPKFVSEISEDKYHLAVFEASRNYTSETGVKVPLYSRNEHFRDEFLNPHLSESIDDEINSKIEALSFKNDPPSTDFSDLKFNFNSSPYFQNENPRQFSLDTKTNFLDLRQDLRDEIQNLHFNTDSSQHNPNEISSNSLNSTEKPPVGLPETEKVYVFQPQSNELIIPVSTEEVIDIRNNLVNSEKLPVGLPEIETVYEVQAQHNESAIPATTGEVVDTRNNLGNTEKISVGLPEIEKVYDLQAQHNESPVPTPTGEAVDARNNFGSTEKPPGDLLEIEKFYDLQPQNEERQSVPFQTNEPTIQQDIYENRIEKALTDLQITQNEKESFPTIRQEVSGDESTQEKFSFETIQIGQVQEPLNEAPSTVEKLPTIEYKSDLGNYQTNIQTENISVGQLRAEPIVIDSSPVTDTSSLRESVQTIERMESGSSSSISSTSSTSSSSDSGSIA